MEDRLIKILSLLTSFTILASALYLFGYWSSFGINILEFIGLSDILKLGVYPVVIGTAGFILGLLVPQRSYQGTEKEIATLNKIDKYVKILILVMLLVFTVWLYIQSDPFFWHISGVLVAGILIFTIKDIQMLEPFIPNPRVRSFVISAVIASLPVSFGIGKANAQRVLRGSGKVVSTKIFKETDIFKNKGLLEQDTLKFVGAAGDYFFFITMDNSVTYAAKYSDLHFLELKTQ